MARAWKINNLGFEKSPSRAREWGASKGNHAPMTGEEAGAVLGIGKPRDEPPEQDGP